MCTGKTISRRTTKTKEQLDKQKQDSKFYKFSTPGQIKEKFEKEMEIVYEEKANCNLEEYLSIDYLPGSRDI